MQVPSLCSGKLIWSIHALWKPDLKLLEPGELGVMVSMSSFTAVFVSLFESDELRQEPERLHADMGRNTALLCEACNLDIAGLKSTKCSWTQVK